MAIGSGLGSSFGISAESAFGTFVAPARLLRAKSYTIERVAQRQQGEGIQSGNFGPVGAQYVETTNAATATVSMDVQSQKMGVLFNVLMGGTVTPAAQGASVAYLATFPLADTYGKSFTAQIGLPYRTGTAQPHTLTGGKVASATFSCDMGGILTASLTIDGKSFTTAQGLAVPSYTTSNVFHFAQSTLKLGTYSADHLSETAVSGVRNVSVSIERPHDVGDYTAGSSGTKSEPVLNGPANISVDITADWLAKATFQDLAHGTTPTSLVWEFVGPLIPTTMYYETFRITLPSVYFEPATQGVGGPGELTNAWKAVWRYDGANLPSIETISKDTAL